MSEKLGIGEPITTPQERDAIHCAVVPVQAGVRLLPGQKVVFKQGEAFVADMFEDAIGVVDPFLAKPLKRGEKFWLFLNPGSITSLRHDWTHPAFVNTEPQKRESEKWLRNLCITLDLDYDTLLKSLSEAVDAAEPCVYGGDDSTANVLANKRGEVLKHFSIITGKTFTEAQVEKTYFTCSC